MTRALKTELSPKQLTVLTLLAEGWTNCEIAALMFISEATVKRRVEEIRAFLDAANRTNAVALGFRKGLLK